MGEWEARAARRQQELLREEQAAEERERAVRRREREAAEVRLFVFSFIFLLEGLCFFFSYWKGCGALLCVGFVLSRFCTLYIYKS